jgi:hypothetical protein
MAGGTRVEKWSAAGESSAPREAAQCSRHQHKSKFGLHSAVNFCNLGVCPRTILGNAMGAAALAGPQGRLNFGDHLRTAIFSN